MEESDRVIKSAIHELTGGDPSKVALLGVILRGMYEHVEEATRTARLEQLKLVMDEMSPPTYFE